MEPPVIEKEQVLIPTAKRLRKRLGSFKRSLLEAYDEAARRLASPERVFTEIYGQHKWGDPAAKEDFDSGLGSSASGAVETYISALKRLAADKGFAGKTFVDIGCGDFRVSSKLLCLANSYIGVDVVAPLIDRNRRMFAGTNATFEHIDATKQPLPPGDVCLLRQVLQHLSNKQIAVILPKLGQYKWVVITEHVPTDANLAQPNLDKVHGADVRVYQNSGVCLDQPPFNIPSKSLSLVLEVPGTYLGPGTHPGVIRTYLYEPSKVR